MNYKRLLSNLIILLFHAIVSWLWFLPVFWRLSDGSSTFSQAFRRVFLENNDKEFFLGDSTDLQGTIWVFSWFDKILLGESDSILESIYSPIGFDLGLNTGFGWADAFFAWPYFSLIGSPGFYNLHVFVTLWLSGVFLTLLFRSTGAGLLVSLGISLVALHHPFSQEEIFRGRPTQVNWWFHCLLLISILQLMKPKPKLKWALLGGISLAMGCLIYWFGAAAVGFTAAIAYALHLLQSSSKVQHLIKGISLAATAIILCLIATWRLSSQYLMGENTDLFPQLTENPWITWSILGRKVPLFTHAQINSQSDFLFEIQKAAIPETLWPMMLIAILIPVGLKRRWPWLIAGAMALSLPLPAALNFGDWWLPTSNALLQFVFPPLERCGFVHRMVIAPILIICLTAAMAIADLSAKIPWKACRFGVQIGFASLFFQWGYQYIPIDISPPISSLKADRDVIRMTEQYPGGLIHVPIEHSGNAHIQQLFHGQPILAGPGIDSVRPEEHKEYCDNNSFLQALEMIAAEELFSPPIYAAEDLQQLHQDGFSLIQIDLRRSKSSAEIYQQFVHDEGFWQPGRHLLIIPLPTLGPEN